MTNEARRVYAVSEFGPGANRRQVRFMRRWTYLNVGWPAFEIHGVRAGLTLKVRVASIGTGGIVAAKE